MSDPITVPYIAVCNTPGCENQDLPIPVHADPVTPNVFCGACTDENGYNTQITDLTPVE